MQPGPRRRLGRCRRVRSEVAAGFEPAYTALQAVASPLGHATEWEPVRPAGAGGEIHASGRRDSNPRPSPWQGDALPTEPRPRALRPEPGWTRSGAAPPL